MCPQQCVLVCQYRKKRLCLQGDHRRPRRQIRLIRDIMLLAVYKTMYENASKIALNAMCRYQFNKSGLPYICIALF